MIWGPPHAQVGKGSIDDTLLQVPISSGYAHVTKWMMGYYQIFLWKSTYMYRDRFYCWSAGRALWISRRTSKLWNEKVKWTCCCLDWKTCGFPWGPCFLCVKKCSNNLNKNALLNEEIEISSQWIAYMNTSNLSITL